jgi:Na+/H+ antiporter NhaD/arsenite permease-like protein
MSVTLLIFLLVYVAMGFGRLPGFRLDRTGAALVGMLAMIVAGSISAPAAWAAIDYRTIALLFGLMVVSAGFVVSGFYAWVAERMASLTVPPPLLLAIFVVTGGILSALLTNDVVVVAMTPLLVSVSLARNLNPVPFLLAFCFAANTGSSGTLIGSPQNMIVAQTMDLSFTGFLRIAAIPALLSLPIVWATIALIYRNKWTLPETAASNAQAQPATELDRWETAKAGIVMIAVIAAFIFSPWPREMIALGAACVLLINRNISSVDVLTKVDGNLLILVMGLFVVNAAMAATGVPQMLIADARDFGLNLHHPAILLWVGAVLSDLVGNNPAVMLLAPLVHGGAHPDQIGAALALGTGFSSNLLIFGSLAGIIVVEQAARRGINISFGEFARAGVPVTLACMAMATLWIVVILR